jgi:transglutaminase-like putative cysteine protease
LASDEFGVSLLTVRHVTVYRYADPVALGEHRMMFRPRESHDLRLIEAQLDIVPRPTQLRWVHDVFDNSVAVATFSGRTTELRFESTVTLEHTETELPRYALDPAAATYPFAYANDDLPDLARALRRRFPDPDVDRWAESFLTPSGATDTIALLRAITIGIREQLSYTRRLERGMQSPSETLRCGSGSCRDFALLMMEGVRSLGFAARFVSGYIFGPDAEPSGTLGGGATHAWLQVYLPGAGWVDFDPTNRIIGNRHLIRVAVAWEPGQALPLWGSFIGYASSCLGMDVTVNVVDGTRPSQGRSNGRKRPRTALGT